jgi:hypothetical protein
MDLQAKDARVHALVQLEECPNILGTLTSAAYWSLCRGSFAGTHATSGRITEWG